MEKTQRNQELVVRTGRKKTYILMAVVVALLVLGAVLLLIGKQLKKKDLLVHDENACLGTPQVKEGYLYGTIATDYGYEFGIAANLYQQEDGSVRIYLTNLEKNEVYLKCDIKDADTDKVIYRSGWIKPGEYLEKVSPVKKISNEDRDIRVIVYAFEPETFYSEGTTSLSMILHKW